MRCRVALEKRKIKTISTHFSARKRLHTTAQVLDKHLITSARLTIHHHLSINNYYCYSHTRVVFKKKKKKMLTRVSPVFRKSIKY